jgi:hypothetical protein
MARSVSKRTTIKEILAARDAARQEIYDKARQLQHRAETIKDIGYTRRLNAQELDQLKKINAGMGSLYAAENDLMLMTVAALDRTDEVQRFINVVQAVNANLKATLQNVAEIAEQLNKLGTLFRNITAVVTALTKLLALL